jgi:hypothetical protein
MDVERQDVMRLKPLCRSAGSTPGVRLDEPVSNSGPLRRPASIAGAFVNVCFA